MQSGPTSETVRVSVQGTARCMDCFDEAISRERDSSGKGFFKLHEEGKIHITDTTIDELLENWKEILPTDERLGRSWEMIVKLMPEYCLTRGRKRPNRGHNQIIPLSAVIVLEYVGPDEKRVRGSHVLHVRNKSGFEMERKVMLYLIGMDTVTDGIGSRSIVPTQSYAKVIVKAMRDFEPYQWTLPLEGAIHAANYSKQDIKEFEGRAGIRSREDRAVFKRFMYALLVDKKDVVVKSRGEERPARDIEWITRFGSGRGVWDHNVGKHMFYTASEYTRMNGHQGQDDMDYQIRREEKASETYTVAHWKILQLLTPTIYDPMLRGYAQRVVGVRLEEAMASAKPIGNGR